MAEIIWTDLNRHTAGPVAKIRTSGGVIATIYNDDYINKTQEQILDIYYQRAVSLYKAYGLERMIELHEHTRTEIEERKLREKQVII